MQVDIILVFEGLLNNNSSDRIAVSNPNVKWERQTAQVKRQGLRVENSRLISTTNYFLRFNRVSARAAFTVF